MPRWLLLCVVWTVAACSLQSEALPPPSSDSDVVRTDSGAIDSSADADAAPLDSSRDTMADSARDTGADAPSDTSSDAGCVAAAEECNGRDDDCDGTIDEMACGDCTYRTNAGREYLFCTAPHSWDDARTDCMARGWDLVVIETAAEDRWVGAEAVIVSDEDWWIGLSDQAVEATYVWVDGTVNWTGGGPRTYANYRDGIPCDSTADDCLELSMEDASTWVDDRCAVAQAYICERP